MWDRRRLGPRKDGANSLTRTDRRAGAVGRNQFQGLAGAFRYQFAKKWAFAPRLEWYRDRDGFITGTGQNLKEVTTTLEYKANDWALLRLEYRRDQSDYPFFDKHNGLRR